MNKKYYRIKSLRGLMDVIFDEQYKLIKKRFGKKAADTANYGWGTSARKSDVSVATKIYLHNRVLTTYGQIGDRRIDFDHSFTPYR